MLDEERGTDEGAGAPEPIEGHLADLLDTASLLLGSASAGAADVRAITVQVGADPSEATAVWRFCKQLAERRGLHASAMLHGHTLDLRFRRPEQRFSSPVVTAP